MTKTELLKRINELGNEIDYLEEGLGRLESSIKDLRKAWEELPAEESDIEEDEE